MQMIINKHLCPNMLNSGDYFVWGGGGGFSNLGALSKFQVRDPNTNYNALLRLTLILLASSLSLFKVLFVTQLYRI